MTERQRILPPTSTNHDANTVPLNTHPSAYPAVEGLHNGSAEGCETVAQTEETQ